MAHECIRCGSECYCQGDISDSVDSLTPPNCRGCGCEEEFGSTQDEWDDDGVYPDDWDDDAADPNLDTNCPFCGREYDEIDYEFQRCHFCAQDDD